MILLLATLFLAQTRPESGVNLKIENVDMRTVNYLTVYTKCFEQAAVASKTAALDVKQRRFDECRAQRPALTQHFESQKFPGHLRASRGLERSLDKIETVYGKLLNENGVVDK